MNPISAIVSAEVNANQITAFEHIVPIDLTSIFTGYGPLPAVTGSQHQTGAWDAAGQTRTVQLSDGSSAQELMTKYDHPHYFSYTVSGFTGSLRFLADSADGEWWFDRDAMGKTTIKWHYAFNPRSAFTAPILALITKTLWRGYMKKALSLSIKQVEKLEATHV